MNNTTKPIQAALDAAEGEAKPATDTSAIIGTWPGNLDDGFEEAIEEARHPRRCGKCGRDCTYCAEGLDELVSLRADGAWEREADRLFWEAFGDADALHQARKWVKACGGFETRGSFAGGGREIWVVGEQQSAVAHVTKRSDPAESPEAVAAMVCAVLNALAEEGEEEQ
jgi:hypothetical protein